MRLHGHGCNLTFDARMWASKGGGPLWLRVFGLDFKYSERAERAITTHLGHERCITFETVREKGELMGLWVPIDLPGDRNATTSCGASPCR